MRHDRHSHILIRQLLDGLQDLARQLRIERGGRFIEEHDLRAHRERPRDGDTLLLTAGKTAGIHVFFIEQADLA